MLNDSLFHSLTDLPYRSIVWRRLNGQALPVTARQADGELIISDMLGAYAGDYECEILTMGGIRGNAVATIRVDRVESCPRGYTNPPSCNECDRGYIRDREGRCTEDVIIGMSTSAFPQ